MHSIATDSKGNLYTTETYRGQARAEVRLQGPRAGDEDEPGRRLADDAIDCQAYRSTRSQGWSRELKRLLQKVPIREGPSPFYLVPTSRVLADCIPRAGRRSGHLEEEGYETYLDCQRHRQSRSP